METAAGSDRQLLQRHRRQPIGSDRQGTGRRQVDDAAMNVGTTVIDANNHRQAVPDVGDFHHGAETQRAMRRGERIGKGIFAVGDRLVAVDRGDAAVDLRGMRRRTRPRSDYD